VHVFSPDPECFLFIDANLTAMNDHLRHYPGAKLEADLLYHGDLEYAAEANFLNEPPLEFSEAFDDFDYMLDRDPGGELPISVFSLVLVAIAQGWSGQASESSDIAYRAWMSQRSGVDFQ
jgi:hypothetical protein